MQDHLHGSVFLVHKYGVKGAVVKHNIEALRTQVVVLGKMHHEIFAERGDGEEQDRKKNYAGPGKRLNRHETAILGGEPDYRNRQRTARFNGAILNYGECHFKLYLS